MSRILKGYENQITGKYIKGKHNGVDLVGYKSKACWITSHSDGTVVGLRTNYNKTDKTGQSYGNYVKIKHLDGYYTLYAHLKYGTVKVKLNQKVKRSQEIGYMGKTGRSEGVHLHWEVRNREDEFVNPTPFLDKDLPDYWEVAEYRLLKSKAIRRDHKLGNNIVKVKECTKEVQKHLTSTKPNDDAYFKVGTKVNITEIYKETNGRVWGKLTNTWIVLCNKDGSKQAERLSN